MVGVIIKVGRGRWNCVRGVWKVLMGRRKLGLGVVVGKKCWGKRGGLYG